MAKSRSWTEAIAKTIYRVLRDRYEEPPAQTRPLMVERERVPPDSLKLHDASVAISRLWLDEIERYCIRTAQTRAAHFGADEVTPDDIFHAYAGLQDGATLERIQGLVGQRLQFDSFLSDE